MDSRDLKAFLLIAETLHFGRAAQLGNMSPSALSRTIQRLEAELDCRLFDRNNREVRLTQQGRVLQGQARELLERMQALRGQVRADSRALQGSVSLYCSVTASYSLLAGLLPEFRARRRNLRGAFAVDGDAVAGRRVLLMDDVVTTGTTVAEAARALLRAGAAEVRVLAAARVDAR